jgi:hypothetical protein
MPRVKRGTVVRARHKKVLKQAKGFRGRRKNVYRVAKQAVMKAGQYAYRDRRTRKRVFRQLWSTAAENLYRYRSSPRLVGGAGSIAASESGASLSCLRPPGLRAVGAAPCPGTGNRAASHGSSHGMPDPGRSHRPSPCLSTWSAC